MLTTKDSVLMNLSTYASVESLSMYLELLFVPSNIGSQNFHLISPRIKTTESVPNQQDFRKDMKVEPRQQTTNPFRKHDMTDSEPPSSIYATCDAAMDLDQLSASSPGLVSQRCAEMSFEN